MACFSGSSYKEDVNIGNVNFYPVEINLHGRRVGILDSFGRYLGDQQDQERLFKEKKREEEELKRYAALLSKEAFFIFSP
jgi:hypothetical protein